MLPTELSSTAMRRSPCALLTIEWHYWFPSTVPCDPFIWKYGLGQARGLFQERNGGDAEPNP